MCRRKIDFLGTTKTNIDHIHALVAQAIYQCCLNRFASESDIVPYNHGAGIDDLCIGFADTVGDIFIEFVRNTASNIIGLKTANRLTHLGAPQGW